MMSSPVLWSVSVWCWILLANVIDTFATRELIASGRIKEANPIAGWLITHSGYSGLLAFKVTCIGALLVPLIIHVRRTNEVPTILIVVAVVYTVLVIYQALMFAVLGKV